jgi:hypothetical protein
MRILERLSGLAVLLLALHFVHMLHHFYKHATDHTPAFWAGMLAAVVVWMLALIGGCLLLKRSR